MLKALERGRDPKITYKKLKIRPLDQNDRKGFNFRNLETVAEREAKIAKEDPQIA